MTQKEDGGEKKQKVEGLMGGVVADFLAWNECFETRQPKGSILL